LWAYVVDILFLAEYSMAMLLDTNITEKAIKIAILKEIGISTPL
jgi:hypothetical protein